MKLNNIFKSALLLAFIAIFTNCTDSDKSFKTGTPEIQTYQLTTADIQADSSEVRQFARAVG